MGKAAQAQAGRDRARDARLKAARERRLKLDPDQLARERRIDEASVDVEVAWEERAQAEQALADAEVAAAAAIERLLAERLAVKDVVHLTGLDQATVRRLRQSRRREPGTEPNERRSVPLLRVPAPRWRDGGPADRRDQPPASARAAEVVDRLAADLDPDRSGRVAQVREAGWSGTHHRDPETGERIVGHGRRPRVRRRRRWHNPVEVIAGVVVVASEQHWCG